MEQNVILMPRGAEILDLQMQRGVPCLWAKVLESEPMIERTFLTIGTGRVVPNWGVGYIGTYQSGEYVWHVFEVTQ